MSLEKNFAKKIPIGIKRFRYYDMLFTAYTDRNNNPRFIIKKTKWEHHFDFFINENNLGLVLTKETRRGELDEHTIIDYEKFMKTLGDMYFEMWKALEWLEKDELRFVGKKVNLYTIPHLYYSGTRKRKAYVEHVIYGKEKNFEKIDTFEPQIGSIEDENGKFSISRRNKQLRKIYEHALK